MKTRKWVYMIGMHGYLPDYHSLDDSVSFDTERQAKRALIEHLGLDNLPLQSVKDILRNGYLDLDDSTCCDDSYWYGCIDPSASLWYCEVCQL